MTEHRKKERFASPLRIALAGVFCLVLVLGLVAAQVVRADGQILPNVSVGGISVGGLTPPQARAKLEEALRAVNVGGLQFRYQDRNIALKASAGASASADVPIAYDLDGMAEAAFAFGHGSGTGKLLTASAQALFAEVRQPVLLSVDTSAIRDRLVQRFGNQEQPARDASLTITQNVTLVADQSASGVPQTRRDWNIDVQPDSTGLTFDYDRVIASAVSGLGAWRGADIELHAEVKPPSVTSGMAMGLKDRALNALRRGDVSLAFDDQRWTIPASALPDAIDIRLGADGQPHVVLKHEALGSILDQAAAAIETDPKPTHFTLGEDGRVRDFDGGALGRRLDREASLARIDGQFETSAGGDFPLAVTTISSSASDALAQEMGISELLGYGTSNFAGSPVNRRKNIANGARLLNGLVIRPGETLSLLDHLRPFDAGNGYFPELVIKEKRTVPEFGGGLCQIGTTTFRATMGAGLPVVERQNHSYRVVYYEPAGTDATIYDPAPDYKFLNDTAHDVVLITRQIDNTLRFELWGTRDGRVQKQSPVKIWNVTPPPEPKLIPTSALPDGTKKCFESAHAGATTLFTYTITYPDGTPKAQDFRSVYRPWQQQCLVGTAGAPNIVIQRDGAIKELPTVSASATPAAA